MLVPFVGWWDWQNILSLGLFISLLSGMDKINALCKKLRGERNTAICRHL